MKHSNKELGSLGEKLAKKYIENEMKLTFLAANYRQKWGELDLVFKDKEGKIYFFEVKSVSYETSFDPVSNFHSRKIQRLLKTINRFLAQNNMKKQTWFLKLITVKLLKKEKKAFFKVFDIY